MKTLFVLTLTLSLYATSALSQSGPGAQSPAKHNKPVVFLNGSGATQTTASRGLFGTVNSSTSQHDQTAEMAKDFTNSCPDVTLSIKQDTADYSVILNWERNRHMTLMVSGSDGTILLTDNKMANILTGTVHGTTVKDKVINACAFITGNWTANSAHAPATATIPAPVPVPQATPMPTTPTAQAAVVVAPPTAPQQQSEVSSPQTESLGDIARRYKKTNPSAQLGQ